MHLLQFTNKSSIVTGRQTSGRLALHVIVLIGYKRTLHLLQITTWSDHVIHQVSHNKNNIFTKILCPKIILELL